MNATAWQNATGGPAYNGANACDKDYAYSEVTIPMRASANAANATAYKIRFCHGDNDWTHPSLANAGNAEFDYLVNNRGLSGVGETPENAAGRNRLCALSPILPLTASRATIQARINGLTAPRETGGTTIVTGMQGAWFTLSPRWQGYWPGIATSAQYGALPLSYDNRNVIKAVVLLTDGDNNWWPRWRWTQVRSSPSGNEYMYNAYGRIADWNANFPDDPMSYNPSHQSSSADLVLSRRFLAVCEAMKAVGIRIYIVGFEVANQTRRQALRDCATEPNEPYFMEAPSAADLENAFRTIASRLASLRRIN